MSRERGSGSVLALALLSGFCLLAMLSWQRTLQVSLELARAQRQYLQAFHQAESSLAWGLSQHWPARHGECRQHPTAPLRVCLQVSGRGYGWLLRGEGGGTMLATALLAFTALGLLDYRQRLAVFQRRLQDASLALSLCHQRLELLRQPTAPGALSQPPGWRISVIEISCDAACRRVTAMVTLPTGERISLNEWVYQNPADITGT